MKPVTPDATAHEQRIRCLDTVGFSLISPELRPSLKAILSFAFSVGLSLAC